MDVVTTTGTIEYRTHGVGVEGEERFEIMRFGNGRRQLRATSEMHNDELVRNTFLAVDREWRPEIAHVHLALGGRSAGSGHYVIGASHIDFHGCRTAGPRAETREVIVPAFGGHALQNDAWLLAAADYGIGDVPDRYVDDVVISSRLPNGADGPALLFSNHHYRYLGNSTIETRAGDFECRHFELRLADKPPIHYWLHGEDYLLIRCRWELLRQSYELVKLG